MPEAMQCTLPDALVEQDHGCEIDKNHGHQPYGKDIKA